jgi:hypothetical protein
MIIIGGIVFVWAVVNFILCMGGCLGDGEDIIDDIRCSYYGEGMSILGVIAIICFWPVVLALYIKWTFVQSTIGIWISDVLDGFGDWFTKPRFGGK